MSSRGLGNPRYVSGLIEEGSMGRGFRREVRLEERARSGLGQVGEEGWIRMKTQEGLPWLL